MAKAFIVAKTYGTGSVELPANYLVIELDSEFIRRCIGALSAVEEYNLEMAQINDTPNTAYINDLEWMTKKEIKELEKNGIVRVATPDTKSITDFVDLAENFKEGGYDVTDVVTNIGRGGVVVTEEMDDGCECYHTEIPMKLLEKCL